MFGRRLRMFRNLGAGRGRNQMNHVQSCVCPVCGYSVQHERGVPCRSLLCPKCNVPLVPDDLVEATILGSGYSKDSSVLPRRGVSAFPVVNKDLCTGCGTCVDICPKGAIDIIDGVAVIDNSKCKKCRLCIQACPMDAIS
ncbi:4Fe-4S binding protein [Bacteroides graminisolvens]|jgi:NAD-dependent dihydropyrimidine dehydrogenase PreA subunit|nr:4Fe-4S binding protein [Bacteroides graminisolvens]MBP9495813.1 4Fe-4S binding protein [Bacteroides sp.]